MEAKGCVDTHPYSRSWDHPTLIRLGLVRRFCSQEPGRSVFFSPPSKRQAHLFSHCVAPTWPGENFEFPIGSVCRVKHLIRRACWGTFQVHCNSCNPRQRPPYLLLAIVSEQEHGALARILAEGRWPPTDCKHWLFPGEGAVDIWTWQLMSSNSSGPPHQLYTYINMWKRRKSIRTHLSHRLWLNFIGSSIQGNPSL